MDFGSNCRLEVCFLHLIFFWFYVYLSLVFSAYYHWWICLLVWLLSSFFYIYIFFSSPFSLFVNVYVYASLCDFVRIGLLLPDVLGFCLFVFLFLFFFFLPFLLSHVAVRVLVLWLDVRREPPRSRTLDHQKPPDLT